jgi:Ubiquitin elongating factor core
MWSSTTFGQYLNTGIDLGKWRWLFNGYENKKIEYSRELAIAAEENMEAVNPPVFLRFANLLINDSVFLLDEAITQMATLREKQAEKYMILHVDCSNWLKSISETLVRGRHFLKLKDERTKEIWSSPEGLQGRFSDLNHVSASFSKLSA